MPVLVQARLPFDIALSAAAGSPPPAEAVEFVRVRRARRYILRVRPDGTLRITVPRGGSRAEGERFAQRHSRWIERERARIRAEHPPVRWHDGTSIPLRGVEHAIRLTHVSGRLVASYGDRAVRVPDDCDDLRRLIEGDLRALARAELVPRLHQLAGELGVAIERTVIRNQRSRWGSCSPTGTIALNFRLIQMPDAVRDYVLIHELMHRKQQNHSRRFWRLVEAACPDFREAERWLKTHGRGLF